MSTSPILIVSGQFYIHISEMLEEGAIAALHEAGSPYHVLRVPGALEIPAVIASAHHEKSRVRYAGFIALGCIIRGETSHYDIVCEQSALALQQLSIHHQLAIGNGILTVENEAQALRRADPKQKNKGGDAAAACLAVRKAQQQLWEGRL